MTTALSGWCATDLRHDSACRVCAMRQREGLLAPCGCPGHQSNDEKTESAA